VKGHRARWEVVGGGRGRGRRNNNNIRIAVPVKAVVVVAAVAKFGRLVLLLVFGGVG
jgi:hypothetical protein